MSSNTPRVGMPDPQLEKTQFRERFLGQFQDPAFDNLKVELDRVIDAAWDGYTEGRKSPRTEKAGKAFADPSYDLAVDWVKTHQALLVAQSKHDAPEGRLRVLLINCSSRSEHTCPGEMSKSWRFLELAREIFSAADVDTEILDLSRLASEYGRKIHPCKACFSTAAALCHWPCSCYPNYSLGQTQDWMNEIYPLWVAAHGVMIITPVNWYQATSPLKLMIDRLVCADGGNPDPTSTQGKDPKLAKSLELKGWPYPRHLAGRLFSVIVHGDTEGTSGLRRNLSDWLKSMDLLPAGINAEVDRYIGYWKPYATSHEDLDADTAIQEEVRNAARTLVEALGSKRAGKLRAAGEDLEAPREK